MISGKFRLLDRRALITGAAGLLGRQHAKAILDVGGSVWLTDINSDLLFELYKSLSMQYDSSKIGYSQMDVTKPASIQDTGVKLELAGWNVDILINNAAIDPKVILGQENNVMSRLENITLDQWNLELDVGLTGAFLCAQYFGARMAKSNIKGVILNIASDLSIISPNQALYRVDGISEECQPVKPVTYSVIKTGLIGLTRYLATYWAGKVRCNALSPGGIRNSQNHEFVERLTALIPEGRMAEPDEYISAVQFLCSEASEYMNGQNLIMDGGRSTW